jgi:hypothetical protein
MKLLGQRAIRRSVLLSHGDKTVSIRSHSCHDFCERAIVVAAVVLADLDFRVQVFEEGEGCLVNIEVMTCFPLSNCVVEELGGGQSNEIPEMLV